MQIMITSCSLAPLKKTTTTGCSFPLAQGLGLQPIPRPASAGSLLPEVPLEKQLRLLPHLKNREETLTHVLDSLEAPDAGPACKPEFPVWLPSES